MKIIEVIADAGHKDTIIGIAEQYQIEDIWFNNQNDDTRFSARLLVADETRQPVLDALQAILQTSDNYHIVITPVDTALPKPAEIEAKPQTEAEKKEDSIRKKAALASTREEILAQVEKNTQLDNNFILLVVLSAIVASVGLLENNVAVIVGAMVIAPLLGPNMAFSLGTSLGESKLVIESIKAMAVGISLSIILAIAIGLLWNGRFDSAEIIARTDVAYSSTVIALASGAAASLSLVSGTSSVLVGVMVAVALMPPAVTIGLMLSVNEIQNAYGAALLLAMNIVCINLSAKLVFLLRGIKPRTWLDARKAKQSSVLYITLWAITLLLLCLSIYLRHYSTK